jgi:hypothetical protein
MCPDFFWNVLWRYLGRVDAVAVLSGVVKGASTMPDDYLDVDAIAVSTGKSFADWLAEKGNALLPVLAQDLPFSVCDDLADGVRRPWDIISADFWARLIDGA